MNSELEAKRAARHMATSFNRILDVFINEANRTLAGLGNGANVQSTQPSSPGPQLPGWVGRKELAKHLGVSERTVFNWMVSRRLPYMKLGRTVRFKLDEVDAHLRRNQVAVW